MACRAGRTVTGIRCSIIAGKAAAWKAGTAPEGAAPAVASDKVQPASGTHAIIWSTGRTGRTGRIGRIWRTGRTGRISPGRSCFCLPFLGPYCLVRCAVIRKWRTPCFFLKIREGNVLIRHGAGLPFLKFRQGHIVKPGRRHVVWLLSTLCRMCCGRRYRVGCNVVCKGCCSRRTICSLRWHGTGPCRGRDVSSRCLSCRAGSVCLSLAASCVPWACVPASCVFCIAAGRKGRTAVKRPPGTFAQHKLAAASGTAQGRV